MLLSHGSLRGAPRRGADALRSMRGCTRFVAVLLVVTILLVSRVYYDCAPYVCARRPPSPLVGYPQQWSPTNNTAQSSARKEGTKSIVIASLSSDNTSWMQTTFPEWENNIYVMDDPQAELSVAKNKGKEAMAYLTYLIDNYGNLPDYIVFSHAARWQWHNDDPMYGMLPRRPLELWEDLLNINHRRHTSHPKSPPTLRQQDRLRKSSLCLDTWLPSADQTRESAQQD